ncbi:MAG: hypothetical protein QOK48_68, partial [Blastocatellia bacterium]|nr:hypothetical protein [Blastocatellia bacterium]
MKSRNSLVVVLLGSLLFPLPTLSQSPATQQPTKPATEQSGTDDQDIVKINTNLVQIDAVVTRSGKQVTDLNAEDFVILQDGKPQAITNFSYVWNVPADKVATAPVNAKGRISVPTLPVAIKPSDPHRTIAFVVDDLGLSFDTINQVRRQLRKFINEEMQPNDLVAIIRTAGEVGTLQQFTTDKRLLANAVERLKWYPCSRAGVSFFEPGNTDHSCANTYRLTLRALRYIASGMGRLPGRKSLVILSDSMPVKTTSEGPTAPSARLAPQDGAYAVPGPAGKAEEPSADSTESFGLALRRIEETAIRSSVVIYAVDTRGLVDTFPSAATSFGSTGQWSAVPARGPGSASRQIGPMMSGYSNRLFLDRQGSGMMANETGGLLMYNSNDFGLKEIVEDQQGYYLIGFRPAGETFNKSFHKISIKLKPKGLAVRTRSGFFGVTDEDARKTQQAALSNVNAILASPFTRNDITVRLNPVFANVSNTGSVLRSFIYINARDLSFATDPNGTHTAAFDVDSILFGDNGSPLYQRSQTARLQLNEEQYQRTLREGVIYDFDLPVKKPGTFHFRVAVRDHDSAKVGTAAETVDVPDLATNTLALSGIVLTPQNASTETSSSNEAADAFTLPGARTFQRGNTFTFGYAIYNAQLDKSTAPQPQLSSRTRIFRNGKLVYTGETAPLSVTGQPDLQRITAGGRL